MVVQKTAFAFKIKNWLTRISIQYDTIFNHQYNARSVENITTYYCRIDVFKNSYFPHTILEWKNLDMQIKRSEYF